ncbi:MAG: ribonuclease P protein component [Polyangiales bacterium]
MASFGFPKERRLRARREFVAVQDKGRRVHTPHFVLIVAKGPDPSAPSRLGVTVTKKIGTAVRRNRVKRLVREAFRLDPGFLPGGVDLVVVAKDGAPTLVLADVQSEWAAIRRLLEKRVQEALTAAPGVPREKRR